MERQFQSPEQWATNAFGEMVFKGNFQVMQNFAFLIFKTTAACFLVFFRHRFGARTLSAFTIMWGGCVMSLFWLKEFLSLATRRFSFQGDEDGATSSAPLFWLHLFAFIAFTTYRIYESRKNLRRTDGREEIRHGQDTGLSLFYPPVAKLLKPFGFVYDGTGRRRWYHFDEFKFQKWVEPLALVVLGLLLKSLGLGPYGSYLILGAISIYSMITLEEEKYLEFKQNHWDGKFAASIMTEISDSGEPSTRHPGMVVQQALMRSDTEFIRWREQNERNQMFDSVETSPPPVNGAVQNPHSSIRFNSQ